MYNMKIYSDSGWIVFSGRWKATSGGSEEPRESVRPLISHHVSTVNRIGQMDSK